MATLASHSKRSSSVKRLLQEAKELRELKAEGIFAEPLEDSIHEFHFTIEGPKDSEFEGGIYHGRICLPAQYPFKPPDIMLLTPNGRFELNKKVCLTITGFHEESWQPAWGIRTALVGLSSFFSTEAKGAIGGLDTSPSERKRLAALSRDWTCPTCQMKNSDILPPRTEADKSSVSELPGQSAAVPAGHTAVPASDFPSVNVTVVGRQNVTVTSNDASKETQAAAEKASAAAVDSNTLPSTGVLCQTQTPASTSPSTTAKPACAQSSAIAQSPAVRQHPRPTPTAASSTASASGSQQQHQQHPQQRNSRGVSISRQQQVEERHLQVVELLTRQLALNDPSAAASSSGVHTAAAAGQSVAFAAPASASSGRAGSTQGNHRNPTPPPIWLDGAIVGVLIALISLLFRKVM